MIITRFLSSSVPPSPGREREAEEDIDVQPPRPTVLRGAFLFVDEWNLTNKLKKRASVMKSGPHCLKGPFRNAL